MWILLNQPLPFYAYFEFASLQEVNFLNETGVWNKICDCTVSQEVRLLRLDHRKWVRSQASPCDISGRRSGHLILFISEYFKFALSVEFHKSSIFILHLLVT